MTVDRDAKALELAWEIVKMVYGDGPGRTSEFLSRVSGTNHTEAMQNAYDSGHISSGTATNGREDLRKIAEELASTVNEVAKKLINGLGE